MSEGLDRARAGEGSLLLIEGAPGVGKTELVRAVLAVAGRSGMTMLVARGSELERSFAFGVVRQLIEPVLRQSPERATAFVGAAGPAARLFGLEESPAWQDDVGFEALHALYWLVVNLADHGPLALVVDDCHWTDPESLRFLNYLAQRIDELPVAMVVAGRPPDPGQQEAAALWPQMGARPSTIMLNPMPLSPTAAAALAVDRLGVDADEAFCRACHTATGGNPLFLRELLRGLAAAGVRPSAEAARQVQDVGPAAVRRFVLHRLTALGSSAAELARTVAVLGDDSELQLVGRVCGLSDEAVRDAADDLVRADIFVRADRLGFVHPIVRAALYEDLVPGERRARHASAADALLAAGAPAERVSAHLLLTTPTGDRRRVETLRAAAAAAARGGAPRVAAVRLRRALAESPGEHGASGDPGRARSRRSGRDAVRGRRRAPAGVHGLPRRRSRLARRRRRRWRAARSCPGGPLAAGRRRRAGVACRGALAPLDPERSLELRSELLMVATAVPQLRVPGLAGAPAALSRAGARASRLRGGGQDPRRPGAAPPRGAGGSRRRRRCRRRSRPASRPARGRAPRSWR